MTIEAIHSLAISFLAGETDPTWTHATLLGGSIAAEFAVAAGIIIETPWPKTWRQWLGVALVIGGVVIGAVFTISLFVFDEAIGRTQQDKIISLEPRRLSPADTAAIVAAVAPFSKEGVAFESYTGDGEAYALGAQLANAFHSTGMWVDPGNLLTVIPSKPVAWGVWLSGDDPRLVAAIMSALKAADIRAVKGEVSDEGSLMSSTPLFKPDVTVFIGMKPLPIAEP